MTPRLTVVSAAVLTCAGVAATGSQPLILGPEHVPIAVSDLEGAVTQFSALGFTLKPGTPHPNGIRNAHAKFSDGTEIELITVAAGVDPLTRRYRAHLSVGAGPAFLALFAPDLRRVSKALATARIPNSQVGGVVTLNDAGLDYLFFGSGNYSPTDRPEHFAHRNSAVSLRDVWIADDERTVGLLRVLGASFHPITMPAPMSSSVQAATFSKGRILVFPRDRQIVAGRPIIGLTVRVADIDQAWSIVVNRGRRDGRRIILEPKDASGLWLELSAERS